MNIRNTKIYELVGTRLNAFRALMFDLKHGVETRGDVKLDDSHVVSENLKSGVLYVGSNVKYLRDLFSKLKIDVEKFCFIDIGAGKGRVLLVASEYAFKKIIGVEFSAKMSEIAQKNIKTYRSNSQKCKEIEAICQDATKFEFPLEPLLIYLFNPFKADVLQKFIKNLEASFEEKPREIILIYTAPFHEKVILESPIFQKDSENANEWQSIFFTHRKPF